MWNSKNREEGFESNKVLRKKKRIGSGRKEGWMVGREGC